MANTMRWRYGDTHPVMMSIDATTVVAIGDLLYVSGGKVKHGGDLASQGTLAATLEAFHDSFIGVAMQCSPSGSAEAIRVATSGVFEFECVSATYNVGDLLGGNDTGAGTLDSQLVDGVATANLAIGRCVSKVSPAGTKVLVDVVSTVVKGGPQVAA